MSNIMRIVYICVEIMLLAFLCVFTLSGTSFLPSALAAQVTLEWDPNSEADLAGYKVYYGTVSQNQTDSIDVGNTTTYTVMGLNEGKTYFFAATAYNISGQESDPSNEVSMTFPSLCSYVIAPSQQSFAATGNNGTVSVTSQAGCPWVASNGASWVTITAGRSGVGSGTVRYSVAPNPGGARLSTIAIADRILTIKQAPASPPVMFTITASAGKGGTISPAGLVSVQAGTSRVFMIKPASKYRISRVAVDGVSKGAISSFTFNNVTAVHTIHATFRRL